MLTDSFIKTIKPKNLESRGDKYSDGGGLYLHVTNKGKYWRMNYRFEGKQKTLYFGSYPALSLGAVRKLRDQEKEKLAMGIDPAAEKKEKKEEQKKEIENSFRVVSLQWLEMKERNIAPGTANKIRKHLETHVFHELGDTDIKEIKPLQLLEVLRKVEKQGAVYTATRLRETCSQIFRYAIQTGRCEINPADALKGAIIKTRVEHRPALTTVPEFSNFLKDLFSTDRGSKITVLCARLGVLTWTRPIELRYARWDEFDLSEKIWRVPAHRMKTGKHLSAHLVPLSDFAIDTVRELKNLTGHGVYLFPCRTPGANAVISENTVNNLFKKIGYEGKQSHHGLRASARSLLSERGWSRDGLERQLDHKEGDQAVAAYARSQHLQERKKFMADWGELVKKMANLETN